MFESKLLVSLRGPRVSPRGISRGYQGPPSGTKKEEVHVPSWRRAATASIDGAGKVCTFMRPVAYIRFETVKSHYTETKEDFEERGRHKAERHIFNAVSENAVSAESDSSISTSSDEAVVADVATSPRRPLPSPSILSDLMRKAGAKVARIAGARSFAAQCMHASVETLRVAVARASRARTPPPPTPSPQLTPPTDVTIPTPTPTSTPTLTPPPDTEDPTTKAEREWKKTGSDRIGKRVLREFQGNAFGATITAWSPPLSSHETDDSEDDSAIPLWHVVHDDGDEEDLDEREVIEAMRRHDEAEAKECRKRRMRQQRERSRERKKRSKVVATSKTTSSRSRDLIGVAISVYWEAEDKWFDGVVDDWDDIDDTALVRYEDGEQSWHDLNDFQWRRLTSRKKTVVKKSAASVRRKSGPALIGSKVLVYWNRPRGKGWFAGTVVEYDASCERHRVLYDDKQTEWHDMKLCRWALGGEGEGEDGDGGGRRRRRRGVK
eukprot:g547.t1